MYKISRFTTYSVCVHIISKLCSSFCNVVEWTLIVFCFFKLSPGIEPGHIPGSVNIPFTEFLTEAGLEKSPETIQGLFQEKKVDLSKPLVATCGSGVTACHVALAAYLCGKPDVAIYDGAWVEWFMRAQPEDIISEMMGKSLWSMAFCWDRNIREGDGFQKFCLKIFCLLNEVFWSWIGGFAILLLVSIAKYRYYPFFIAKKTLIMGRSN